MPDYSTRALLDQLKVRAMLPETDATLTDEELMRLATTAYNTMISPFIQKVKEEYNVLQQTIPVASGTFVNQYVKFPIPARAVGGGIRNLYVRGSVTSTPSNASQVQVPYIPPEDLGATFQWNSNAFYSTGMGSVYNNNLGYTIENDDIVLVAQQNAVNPNIDLLIKYTLRLGNFITIEDSYNPFDFEQQSQNAFQITALDTASSTDFWYLTGSAEVKTEKFPDAESVVVDIFGYKPPFRTRVISAEATCENDGSQVILTFPKVSTTSSYELKNTFIEYPAVGDWVSLEEELPVMKMPVELHEALIQATLIEIYKTLGDMAKVKESSDALGLFLNAQLSLVAPRSQGATRVLMNTRSPLRKGRQ